MHPLLIYLVPVYPHAGVGGNAVLHQPIHIPLEEQRHFALESGYFLEYERNYLQLEKSLFLLNTHKLRRQIRSHLDSIPCKRSSIMSSNVLWEHPDVQSTRMSVFRRHVNRKYNLNLQSYASLHAWSVQEHVEFAQEIWDFCGVQVSEPPSCIGTGLDRMWPRPAWFPGARLNYTENVFAIGLASHPNAVAISSCQEQEPESKHLTWLELRHDVEKWASALRNSGVRQGDRVAGTVSSEKH
jgi:hypothetical protein